MTKKTKILICGATGFIGRNLVSFFSKNSKYEVHAVYNKRPSFEAKNVLWHSADLRDPVCVDRLLEGMDILIQAAATTSGAKDIVTKPYIHVTDNAVMNSYIFRSAFEHKLKHVIFFSCTVMYQSAENAIKESDWNAAEPLHTRYFGVGHTKMYIEKMCEFYAGISDTKYTAIRHSNIYGPFDKFDFEHSHVFGATVSKVMTAEDKVVVWGTGEEKRDLLYVDDLLNFVELAISNQKANYRLYNCGLGEAIAIKDLVNSIVQLSGKTLQIEHDLSQPTIPTSLYLDCSRAKTEIGWEPQTPLATGIQKTLNWWEDNIDPQTLKPKTQQACCCCCC